MGRHHGNHDTRFSFRKTPYGTTRRFDGYRNDKRSHNACPTLSNRQAGNKLIGVNYNVMHIPET